MQEEEMTINIKTPKMTTVAVVTSLLFLLVCNVSFAAELVGQQAKPISINRWITKQNPDLETLDGRVYLLDFWTTWCGPCINSIPEINRLHNTYKEKGLAVIGINCDKSSRKVPNFIKKHKIEYYVAIDAGTAKGYDVQAYPTLVAVDSFGRVIWQDYHSNGKLIEAIEAALENAPPSVIKDVELGPFEVLRQPLSGGEKFAAAYSKVASFATRDNKKAVFAKQIVESIDKSIALQIIEAEKISELYPEHAYKMLNQICSKYGGIDAVRPAKKARFKLKKYADK
jgi:cytochrome c biogenesis protein CcmG/thiol:disulfide interchange protein DsbE